MRIQVYNQNNFYSQRLMGDALRLYNASVENLSRGDLTTRAQFSDAEGMQSATDSVIEAILYGCPELFYVSQQVSVSYSGNEVTLEFANKYRGENVNALNDRLNSALDDIAAYVNAAQGDVDKLERLNNYLCTRVQYTSSTDGAYGDAYGALVLGQARCEGFAKAAKLILDRLGYSSLVAFGEGLSGGARENHSWNIVRCGAHCYHFDFTWNASGTMHDVPGQAYMFLDDATAHIEHFPRMSDYPQCQDASMTFWARHNGVVEYHSDLSRVDIVPFENNYVALARMPEKLTQEELDDEVFDWMRDELAAYNYGSQLSYAYNERLDLLTFYFIN